jgi:hypothetical protein
MIKTLFITSITGHRSDSLTRKDGVLRAIRVMAPGIKNAFEARMFQRRNDE